MKKLLRMFSIATFLASLCGAAPGAWSEIRIDTSSPFVTSPYMKKISMDFQNAPLVDVLKIFSQQSGINIISSQELNSKQVTMYLDNVPIDQALDQLLKANNLTYDIQPNSNIYIVKPLIKPAVEIATRVYQLHHTSVGTSKIRSALNISSDSASSGGTDGAAAAPGTPSSGGGGASGGLAGAIKAILTQHGQVVEDPRTNSLIVTDIPSNFPMIESTIAKLDVPVPQILIEVEMLEVSKTVSDQMGIKWGGRPLEFTGAQRQVVYPWNQNELLAKGYAFEDAEYTAGLVDASGLRLTLEYLRTQSDTKNLARPRILTLNNETAQIKISTQEAIGIKESSSDDSSGSNSTSVEAERSETGVILTVTPQANIETSEITMAILPKFIVARTGADFTTTTGEVVSFKDPEERGSQSILRIRDGETIIIGGLLRSDDDKTITKLPILGDIPFIGGAFRHKETSVTDRELIIFITPHILKDSTGSKTAVAKSKRIIREQDAPTRRLDQIERELSNVEDRQL